MSVTVNLDTKVLTARQVKSYVFTISFHAYALKQIIYVSEIEKALHRMCQKNARRLENSCSLNSKATILKTVLFLFPECQIMFCNLPGFDRPFLLVEMGYYLQKAPFENLPKTSENTKQDFPLYPFLAIMTLGCVPLNKLFTLGGRP